MYNTRVGIDFNLNLAHTACAFHLPASAIVPGLADRYRAFLNSEAAAELRIIVRFRASEPEQTEPPVSFRRGSRLTLDRHDVHATIDLAAGRGEATLWESPYTFDSFLRMLYAALLPWHGGFLVHAAVLLREGRAVLLPGLSGAGKSTLCRLSQGWAQVLTDELPIVLRQEQGYQAFGTPFWGNFLRGEENGRAPLDRLYFLVKDSSTYLVPLAPSEALGRLLRCALFFNRDRGSTEELLGLCTHLVRTLPCAELHFTKDLSFQRVLDGPLPNEG